LATVACRRTVPALSDEVLLVSLDPQPTANSTPQVKEPSFLSIATSVDEVREGGAGEAEIRPTSFIW
jgi:hypothetical protein